MSHLVTRYLISPPRKFLFIIFMMIVNLKMCRDTQNKNSCLFFCAGFFPWNVASFYTSPLKTGWARSSTLGTYHLQIRVGQSCEVRIRNRIRRKQKRERGKNASAEALVMPLTPLSVSEFNKFIKS